MPFTSYFFTELDAFTATTQNQSFGPLNENTFNITAGFTLTASKKAFAICKGVVLIQPQSGSSDKVNLILRPFNQPFPDINVKYFIYRGLKKDKFFTSGTNPDVILAGTNSSEFVNKIRTNFSDFFTNRNIAVPDFKATFLGFNEDTTIVLPSTDISDLFFKETILEDDGNGNGVEDTAVAFQLPMAEAGMHVGDFATGDCGIDVVLDYGDYKMDFDNQEFVFDLNYARLPFASIEIPSGLTEVQMKRIREQSTQFIDIVAYFGMFFESGKVRVLQNNVYIEFSNENIYNNLISKFYNKNRVYIYIQSQRRKTYNYFNNYNLDDGNNMKIGYDNYINQCRFDSMKWPLYLFEVPNNTDNDNLFLNLVCSKKHFNVILYVKNGLLKTRNVRNFIAKEDIFNQSLEQDISYTNSFEFILNNIVDGNLKVNVSSIINIIYEGNEINFSNNSTNQIWKNIYRFNCLNDIYPNFSLRLSNNVDNKIIISSTVQYIAKNFTPISLSNSQSILDGFVAKFKVRKYITEFNYIIKEKVIFAANIIDSTDKNFQNFQKNKSIFFNSKILRNDQSDLMKNLYQVIYGSDKIRIYDSKIIDDSNEIKVLNLKLQDVFNHFNFSIGITMDELVYLKSLIQSDFKDPEIYLIDDFELNISNFYDKSYLKFSIGIIYEDLNGELSILVPSNPIYLYGLTHNFLCSSQFSENEEFSDHLEIFNINQVKL